MESYLEENFGAVKWKNSSDEALRRWRRLCGVVKNPKRRFRFTANLDKRANHEKMRVDVVASKSALQFLHGHSLSSEDVVPDVVKLPQPKNIASWDVEMAGGTNQELERILLEVKADRAAPRHLPFEFCKTITGNFSDDLKLGSGGFGDVYKGVLENGETVAVKRLRALPAIKSKQYKNEAILLKLKHENIVGILGYCSEAQEKLVKHEGRDILAEIQEKLICLEYMPNGSLDHHITDASSGMNWNERYKIFKGICCGLHFLHKENQTNTPIIHADLKPDNILLTDGMVPKITDFGLSRIFGEEQTRIYTANNIGTRGYMAPEFIDRGKLTEKSDIFSLGVIVLEMITGDRYGYPSSSNETTRLQDYVEIEVEKWRKLMGDLNSTSVENSCRQIKECIEIGLKCVKPDEMERPTAKEIIESLDRLDSSTVQMPSLL